MSAALQGLSSALHCRPWQLSAPGMPACTTTADTCTASTSWQKGSLTVKGCVGRRLPSFNAEFTASTPLTRIRDIAHRSDIPHELKQEIKHTIQVAPR